jgi:hypothetical protein
MTFGRVSCPRSGVLLPAHDLRSGVSSGVLLPAHDLRSGVSSLAHTLVTSGNAAQRPPTANGAVRRRVPGRHTRQRYPDARGRERGHRWGSLDTPCPPRRLSLRFRDDVLHQRVLRCSALSERSFLDRAVAVSAHGDGFSKSSPTDSISRLTSIYLAPNEYFMSALCPVGALRIGLA